MPNYISTIEIDGIKALIKDNAAQSLILNLQNDLNDEINNRTNADKALQKSIDDETSNRKNADTELQNNITEEETARTNADANLQNNITAEETARTNADKLLDNKINTINKTLNNSRIYNILDYGGVNDGTTDNIDVLNHIMNIMHSGDILLIPSGNWKISSPFTITKSITVIGGGSFPSSKWSSTDEGSIIIVDNTDGVILKNPNITIEGIGVTNIGAKNKTCGIALSGATSIQTGANDCCIKKCCVWGFYAGFSFKETAFKILFESCFAYDCYLGYNSVINDTSLTYLNCWAAMCHTGFWIVNTIYSTLINCACDNSVEGFSIANSKSIGIYNCAAENSQKQSLHITNSNCITVLGFLSVSGNTTKTSMIATTCNIESSKNIFMTNTCNMGDDNADVSILAQGACSKLNIFNNNLTQKINLMGSVTNDYEMQLTAI